tara:strand:- start:3680 stop:4072 length:393 start_codon:yes stop_codon:yes gene_type:complete
MAKVIRTVTLDYDLVQRFKLERANEKLSTVFNQFLGTYLQQSTTKDAPEQLQHEISELDKELAELNSKKLQLRTKLQAHKDNLDQAEMIKWKYYEEVVLKSVPTFAKEKYEANYKEHFYEDAHRYAGNKK